MRKTLAGSEVPGSSLDGREIKSVTVGSTAMNGKRIAEGCAAAHKRAVRVYAAAECP